MRPKSGFELFLESETKSNIFLDSEIRQLKRYCHDNDGVIKLVFVGDNQVAEMQFGPSLYDRVQMIRKPRGYVLVMSSDDLDTGTAQETFNSFKEALRYLESET